jgi:hypothetical protein
MYILTTTLQICREQQKVSQQRTLSLLGANIIRGIPGGYLSALEQRLHGTEIALYNALCELRKLKSESAFAHHPDLSEPLQSHQAATNKYSRMAEWIRYPLKRSDEIENWWNSVENPKLLEGKCDMSKRL